MWYWKLQEHSQKGEGLWSLIISKPNCQFTPSPHKETDIVYRDSRPSTLPLTPLSSWMNQERNYVRCSASDVPNKFCNGYWHAGILTWVKNYIDCDGDGWNDPCKWSLRTCGCNGFWTSDCDCVYGHQTFIDFFTRKVQVGVKEKSLTQKPDFQFVSYPSLHVSLHMCRMQTWIKFKLYFNKIVKSNCHCYHISNHLVMPGIGAAVLEIIPADFINNNSTIFQITNFLPQNLMQPMFKVKTPTCLR